MNPEAILLTSFEQGLFPYLMSAIGAILLLLMGGVLRSINSLKSDVSTLSSTVIANHSDAQVHRAKLEAEIAIIKAEVRQIELRVQHLENMTRNNA